MRPHFFLALAALLSQVALASESEFEGVPSVKVEVAEGNARSQPVSPERAREFSVKVVRSGNGYVWASRNNVPLLKHEAGAYVTYVATTGAGYVRVLSPAMRKAIQALPPEQREKEFVYMEHMVNQLGSITYYGK
jgi:hypothetical protein